VIVESQHSCYFFSFAHGILWFLPSQILEMQEKNNLQQSTMQVWFTEE